jgi:hypothetical protein
MKEAFKQLVRKTPVYPLLRNWLHKKSEMTILQKWEAQGRPAPPPHIIKQRVLKAYANEYNLKVLVETGTCYGDMVEAMKESFEQIYTVELSRPLFEFAKKRFATDKHIEVIQGDSGRELEKIVKKINQPALFWLDGHYSAGITAKGDKVTPIYDELDHIFNSGKIGHVILIDDARLFGTDHDYPSMEDLEKFIRSKRDNVKITIQDDSIRILPSL